MGRVGFDEARGLQLRLAEMRRRDEIGDLILLLEHPPIVTLGRNAPDVSHGDLAVVRTDRGGDVTYHGPGQLVGYPVFKLAARGRAVRTFVWAMQHALCDVSLSVGVGAVPRKGFPGIWVPAAPEPHKLAFIGLAVRRAITLHGFALNVDERSEEGFSGFAPCGLSGVKVTSLSSAGARPRLDLETLAARAARAVAVRTDRRWEPKPMHPGELPVGDRQVAGDGRRELEESRDDPGAILIG